MRFDNDANQGDVQDRRGIRPVHVAGGMGIGGIVLVAVLSLITRHNFFADLATDSATGRGGGPTEGARNEDEARAEQLVRHATTDIENFWTRALPQLAGRPYPRTQLVLFNDVTQSGCGYAESATGPFYCPLDRLVYVDLGFYRELAQRFGAPGEFAQAYVIAHEFGHHVQHVLGIDTRMRNQSASQNAGSVQLELQADCLAGVWGASAVQRGLLDPSEVDQGMEAAAAVGDDRLQRMAGRAVNPERFTHGSSAERAAAFRRGMQGADLAACGIAR